MGNTKSTSSMNSSTSSPRRSTLSPPNNLKPSYSSSAYDTKKFYLNLNELKSGGCLIGEEELVRRSASASTVAASNRPHSLDQSPTSSYMDEYTSLNEIIESIESFCRDEVVVVVPTTPPTPTEKTLPSSVTLDLPRIEQTDNYANLVDDDDDDLDETDLNNNNNKSESESSGSQARPSSLLTPDFDSQLYSNIKVIHRDASAGCNHERRRRPTQRMQQKQQSNQGDKNSSLVQYLVIEMRLFLCNKTSRKKCLKLVLDVFS